MKTEFFTVNVENKDVDLVVRSPSVQDQREAQKSYNKAFTDAINTKSIVRAKMEDVLREQGLWDDDKQKLLTNLQSKISDGEKKLAKGGIRLKDAKQIALNIKKIRDEIRDLISVRTSLDSNTAEGQADNARFYYLVSACVVYKNNEQKTYFKNLEDYLERIDDPAALKGAQILANMLYGLDADYEKNLPENKFLLKYKFVNEDLRFVNDDGKLVDKDGRLVDETGRYIDSDGNFVDKDGNRVDINGDYVVESEPFLDDDGKPINESDNTKTITTEVSADKESKISDSN